MGKPGVAKTTKNPDYPTEDAIQAESVESYLSARNLLRPRETVVRLEPVDVPTRNLTVRVVTSERAWVLKRFLVWPDNGVAAPARDERFQAEALFHRAARIARCRTEPLPKLIHRDASEKCLVFEDAGREEISQRKLTPQEAESLAWFLVAIHHHSQSVPVGARHGSAGIRSWQAARLFPENLFQKPDRGYRWRKRLFAEGPGVVRALSEAAEALQADGASLVHGDYLPNNWIRTPSGLRIVDAEFSFFGRPEFDAGAFVAGLMMSAQNKAVIRRGLEVLERACVPYESNLVAAFAAVHFCANRDGVSERFGAGTTAGLGIYRRLARSIAAGSLARILD